MKKVVIGMSGGVDSSAAAYLLKREGYEVIGVTLMLNDDENSILDAQSVCQKLNIEHHVIDFRKEFKSFVVDNFISAYKRGFTPNPCVTCNKHIKFGLLWQEALKLGAEYLATGHYASIKNNKLCKIDSNKDQSYFLYGINKDLLPKLLFPLNKFRTKDEIRAIARSINLPVSDKKDSQDICFIKNNDYGLFLEQNLAKLPDKGNFKLKDGTIIGSHKGLIYYTIGQRKGLGISYKTPLYVIDIDPITKEITLGDESDLYQKAVIVDQVNLLVDELPTKATAKIRYRAKEEPCEILKIDDDKLKIIFPNKIKSPTKGQSLVLYDNDIVLGGGIIIDTLH